MCVGKQKTYQNLYQKNLDQECNGRSVDDIEVVDPSSDIIARGDVLTPCKRSVSNDNQVYPNKRARTHQVTNINPKLSNSDLWSGNQNKDKMETEKNVKYCSFRRVYLKNYLEDCEKRPTQLEVKLPGSPRVSFSSSLDRIVGRGFIQDSLTSRRIYPEDAVNVVHLLASRLMKMSWGNEKGDNLFKYMFSETNNQRMLDFDKILETPSFCYQVCQNFFRMGLLDHSVFPPRATPMDESCISIIPTSSPRFGTRGYFHKEPDFWINADFTTMVLFPTIIVKSETTTNQKSFAPLAILTHQPLPGLDCIKLFKGMDIELIEFRNAAPFEVDGTQLLDLHLYTVRICRAITNKPYDCPVTRAPYFFVPLMDGFISLDAAKHTLISPSIVDYVPWNLVSLAAHDFAVPLQSVDLETTDLVVQDRWVEFTRRYALISVRHDLSPNSKPLESNYDTILDLCKARVKGFKTLKDMYQPLIEVYAIHPPMNLLTPTSDFPNETASEKGRAKYLVPELCAKFAIPTRTFLFSALLPSITHRINDLLLARELNAKLFNNIISDQLLHIALCTPSCGFEYDYERLELLGDAFLKYLSSVYVLVAHPNCTEGVLHTKRQELTSNNSLFRNALQKGLPFYIRSKSFAPRYWSPPNFSLPTVDRKISRFSHLAGKNGCSGDSIDPTYYQGGSLRNGATKASASNKFESREEKRSSSENVHWLGDKTIADVTEAIIGAAYISGGPDIALAVTKRLGVPILNIERWADFRCAQGVMAVVDEATIRLEPGVFQTLEMIIGHRPSQPYLVTNALTHSPTHSTVGISYKHLEFIGNAILEFLVIEHLFNTEKHSHPGDLTLLKSAMVSNGALAAACVMSSLHKHLLYGSNATRIEIDHYVSKLENNRRKEYELAAVEGRSPGQYWIGLEAPRILSDVVESIIGGIYISDNFSPDGVKAFFNNVLKPFYDRHVTLRTLSQHPTKNLCEILQARGCKRFKILKKKMGIRSSACSVLIHDVVLTRAVDNVTASAARRASLLALEALESDPNILTKNCDCRFKGKK